LDRADGVECGVDVAGMRLRCVRYNPLIYELLKRRG
jgi:hypothetical protein